MSCNKIPCTCTYPGCPRHGKCCECILYHRQKNQLPGCLFSAEAERLYNRNLDVLCRDKGYVKA